MFENLLCAVKEPKQVGDFFLFMSASKGNREQRLNMKFKNMICEKKVIVSGCIIFREVHADWIWKWGVDLEDPTPLSLFIMCTTVSCNTLFITNRLFAEKTWLKTNNPLNITIVYNWTVKLLSRWTKKEKWEFFLAVRLFQKRFNTGCDSQEINPLFIFTWPFKTVTPPNQPTT